MVGSYSNLAKASGFGMTYQHLSNIWSMWNNYFVEPLRDMLWRTPSHKVCELEKYSLLQYDSPSESTGVMNTTATAKKSNYAPLLIVYAFINRHYILDLVPGVSVVRNLLKQGFDIYATDWGTPSAYDKDLTMGHFINKYMDKPIDLIRETTKSDKVSLFGYCWGGDLVLMYSALHPDKVKSVITIATPGDFSVDDTLLSIRTKKLNVESLLDTFGNVPAILLNAAFQLRNPVENLTKFPHFFEKPHGLESIIEFFATEAWLHLRNRSTVFNLDEYSTSF